jgi:hypothetical protein
LASDASNQKLPAAEVDSDQLPSSFDDGPCEAAADDAFSSWLHDDKSVIIDWSTFGSAPLNSNQSPL